jgi:hypothetical protein
MYTIYIDDINDCKGLNCHYSFRVLRMNMAGVSLIILQMVSKHRRVKSHIDY